MDNERTQWAARMLALRVNGMAVLYPGSYTHLTLPTT